jgi:toxin ParE1/3/4
MPLVPLSLSSRAELDLADLWSFIAERDLVAADRMTAKFSATFRRLQRFPKLGEAIEHLGVDFRRFPVEKYVVFYRHVHGEIRIVRVLHSARQWEDLL